VDGLHISALTMMEIEVGIQRLERHDKKQASMLRAWKDGLLRREFRGRILDVDLAVCERCAALHVPDPRPEIDALIAATAIVRRLTLVTVQRVRLRGDAGRDRQSLVGARPTFLSPERPASIVGAIADRARRARLQKGGFGRPFC
jgi:predicted nucleic acid-binding protein